MICLTTNLHVARLSVAGEILLINSLAVLAVLALRSGVGAGPDLHHDPPATRGVARRVHRGPGAGEYKERISWMGRQALDVFLLKGDISF